MDPLEFGDYEFNSDDFLFVVERQLDEDPERWVPVLWEPVDINYVHLENTDWNDLELKGVVYANATWRAALYGEGMAGPPLRTTAPLRIGHKDGCFRSAYAEASERYKERTGLYHRYLHGVEYIAADNIVRAMAASLLEDGTMPCSC